MPEWCIDDAENEPVITSPLCVQAMGNSGYLNMHLTIISMINRIKMLKV